MTNFFAKKETIESPKNSLIAFPIHEISSSDGNDFLPYDDNMNEPIPKRFRLIL